MTSNFEQYFKRFFTLPRIHFLGNPTLPSNFNKEVSRANQIFHKGGLQKNT